MLRIYVKRTSDESKTYMNPHGETAGSSGGGGREREGNRKIRCDFRGCPAAAVARYMVVIAAVFLVIRFSLSASKEKSKFSSQTSTSVHLRDSSESKKIEQKRTLSY